MSNPPFGSPLYSEEDEFSFPIQPPTNDPIDFPPLIQDQNTNLPSTSSQPIFEYQDLSMFLGDDDEEDYRFIGKYDPNNIQETLINWAGNPIEQLGLNQQQQGAAEGSSLGLDEIQYSFPIKSPSPSPAPMVAADDQALPGGGGGSGGVGIGIGEDFSSKKLVHNAKEKVRRMKLNETYLTLRSLLPDSRRAKKKWSTPYMIDRTLDYIPQLQDEIEKLIQEKKNILLVLRNKNQAMEADEVSKSLTISINEVKRGQVIIQICEQNNKVDLLSTLIAKLEKESIHILGASSQRVCDDRSCFHLHLQMGENPVEADYVNVLHRKIISWLS